MEEIIETLFKGIFLAIIYFETTRANDTTLQNISLFTIFYVIMFTTANFVGIDTILVTNAFVTKTVFTIIDERIKGKEETSKS